MATQSLDDDSTRKPAGKTPASLVPLVYDELRALARRYLAREAPGHLLQPTALVHEAYLRVCALRRIDWKGKTHFLAVAATEMRRILVEHARAVCAKKRGGSALRLTLADDLVAVQGVTLTDLLALDEALTRLSARNKRHGQVAEMRLFAGMKASEIAARLRVSERTVLADWSFARAWLARELRPSSRRASP